MRNIKHSLLVLVICCVVGLTAAFNNTVPFLNTITTADKVTTEVTLMAPSASISGTTSVCINDSPRPQIIFTGSGGTRPYTFRYTRNNGATASINTVGTNNSIALNVNTNVAGVFVYKLVSVTDSTGDTSIPNFDSPPGT